MFRIRDLTVLGDGGIVLDRIDYGNVVYELIHYPDMNKIVLFIYSRYLNWSKRHEIIGVNSIPMVLCPDGRTELIDRIPSSVHEALGILYNLCKHNTYTVKG